MKTWTGIQLRQFVVSSLLILCIPVHSFPEFIRHGYVNCMSCHVSPSGGGALTSYGREISKEALSRWSAKNEHHYLQGAINPYESPAWLSSFGGDLRGIQIHRENRYMREGRWLWMQAEGEGGLVLKGITFQVGRGVVEHKRRPVSDWRKAYVLMPIKSDVFLKMGLFQAQHGLNIAEHTSYIKNDLGFTPKNEVVATEFSWIEEKWNYVATLGLPSHKKTSTSLRKIQTQNLSYAFENRYKVGVAQSFATEASVGDSATVGVFALLGYNKQFYSLHEIDKVFESDSLSQTKTNGYIMYHKFGYEMTRGIHWQFISELSYKNLKDSTSRKDSLGTSLVFYPRPHFEIQLAWNRRKLRSPETQWTDLAWLMLHYYI